MAAIISDWSLLKCPTTRLVSTEMPNDRFQELLSCWRNYIPGQERCIIIDSNTYWEGQRWTETLPNGDSMIIAGMTMPLHTQFLVCKKHLPIDLCVWE